MGQIACYCRVSTEQQSMDRQLSATSEYAQSEFGAAPGDIKVYRDKSTGTNTSRSGYREMMGSAEGGDLDAVIVHSVDRVCRSISDLERTASRLNDADVGLHIVSEGLKIKPGGSDPYQNALFQLLGVFAELEANIIQQRSREGIAARMQEDGYHHGRPPLGFDKEDGYLIEAENYGQVVSVLDMVMKGELSKRKASKEMGCGRPTVDRALERAELYGL